MIGWVHNDRPVVRTFALTYGTVGVRIGCDLDEHACRTQALFDVALQMPIDVVVTKCYRAVRTDADELWFSESAECVGDSECT